MIVNVNTCSSFRSSTICNPCNPTRISYMVYTTDTLTNNTELSFQKNTFRLSGRKTSKWPKQQRQQKQHVTCSVYAVCTNMLEIVNQQRSNRLKFNLNVLYNVWYTSYYLPKISLAGPDRCLSVAPLWEENGVSREYTPIPPDDHNPSQCPGSNRGRISESAEC